VATYLSSDKPPVIKAQDLYEILNDGDESNDPFILSVRKPEDYAKGHIPGAVNIPWKALADPENLAKLPTDRPIVVYCYTGHTGAIATTALNLLGYDATNLLFGMMGWTKDDDVLAKPRFNPETQPDYPLETEPNEPTETYELPKPRVGGEVPAEMVRAAVAAYLSSDKPPVIKAQDLYDILNDGDESNDPFILSVRKPEDYAKGHIPGAVNIPWKALADPENLKKLPTDRPIVVYCYTGHTGGIATTILNTLGYDATNLLFGMMGWTKDDDVLAKPRFNPETQPDYPVESGAAASAFEVVRQAAEAYLTSDKPPVIKAQALYDILNDGDESNDPFILSVRKPEDYAKGHIPGAVNIPWKALADPENLAKLPKDKPIVDYCYTGHTGAVAATALNLMGYDATNLLFGMMGWTKDDDVLAKPRFNPETQPDYPLETEPNEPTETYPFPDLEVSGDTPEEIVRAAVDAYLSSDKPPVIKAQDLYDILNDGDESNDPFILSVRKPEDYAKGHIPGAVNIPWKALADPENLKKLPPDQPIVVYCYTGHTGGIATTVLNVLGYDATNLLFGMMGWTKDDDVLAKPRFNPETQPDYPVQQ